nr:hypothetical protein [uncultured Roseateles sp.]
MIEHLHFKGVNNPEDAATCDAALEVERPFVDRLRAELLGQPEWLCVSTAMAQP